MKSKRIISFLLVALLLMTMTMPVSAAGHHTVSLKINDVELDTPVLIVDGRAQVSTQVLHQVFGLTGEETVYTPVREFFELMGGVVTWDSNARTITIVLEDAASELSTVANGHPEPEKPMPVLIPAEVNIQEWGGADVYDNAGDHSGSIYFGNPDFFTMKNSDRLTIIENFKTYQQTAEWSCGPATALMVLHHLGITEHNEWDIAVAMNSHKNADDPEAEPGSARKFGEYGTSLPQMVGFFDDLEGISVVETNYREDFSQDDIIAMDDDGYAPPERGNLPRYFSWMSLYTTDNDDESQNWVEDAADSFFVKWVVGHLEEGRPIMVEWADWGGHWQAIIGYDNMGTPELGDDVLIFADPYDTSDHWQDGYYVYPLERWVYMWSDTRIAPKPFQIQPFLVIDLDN